MIIRKLTPADYHGMLVLYRELDQFHVDARTDFFVRQEDVFPQEAFEANMINPECLMLGAFDEPDNMIGLVRATLWKESGMVKTVKVVCLDDVYVVPEYRRDGIATKLFEAVEQWAREQGAARLELHTWDFNQGAIALYRAMGMTPQRYVFEKKL